VLCCCGECVINARCVQLMYLKLCIPCGAECAGDAYVLVLAGDR
jgi:hypothetical protein